MKYTMSDATSEVGYMLFLPASAAGKIYPQPVFAPRHPASQDAAGWFKAYNCFEGHKAAEAAAWEHQHGNQYFSILPVEVLSDGTVKVEDDPIDETLIATLTAEEIFGSFGMHPARN